MFEFSAFESWTVAPAAWLCLLLEHCHEPRLCDCSIPHAICWWKTVPYTSCIRQTNAMNKYTPITYLREHTTIKQHVNASKNDSSSHTWATKAWWENSTFAETTARDESQARHHLRTSLESNTLIKETLCTEYASAELWSASVLLLSCDYNSTHCKSSFKHNSIKRCWLWYIKAANLSRCAGHHRIYESLLQSLFDWLLWTTSLDVWMLKVTEIIQTPQGLTPNCT